MSEINVTPFVDVMLVLLIVFMVAAPLLTVGVPVDLPDAKGQSLSQNKEPITVSSIATARSTASQEETLEIPALIAKLKAAVEERGGGPDLVSRRPRRCLWPGVAGDQCRRVRAGFKKFTFVSGPEDIAKGPSKR